MSHIIKNLYIEKLFDTTNIDWKLNPSVNVLVGQNGLGKSTILKIISALLLQENIDEIKLTTNCHIDLTNDIKFQYTSLKTSDISIVSKAIELLMKSKDFAEDFKSTLKNEGIYSEVKQRYMINDKSDDVQIILKKLLSDVKNDKSDTSINISTHAFQDNRKDDEQVNIEFISTINMSANSINDLTTSSGKVTTFLDFEINNEIQRLVSFNDDSLQKNLLSALNNLFAETNKTIEFNNNKLVIKLANGNRVPFSKLSSGERQIIFIFLKVVIASVNSALILMDEPEISLHLSWQEKLLNEIRRVNPTSQIIIVTHSPAMLMNGWMDSFVDISNITTNVSSEMI